MDFHLKSYDSYIGTDHTYGKHRSLNNKKTTISNIRSNYTYNCGKLVVNGTEISLRKCKKDTNNPLNMRENDRSHQNLTNAQKSKISYNSCNDRHFHQTSLTIQLPNQQKPLPLCLRQKKLPSLSQHNQPILQSKSTNLSKFTPSQQMEISSTESLLQRNQTPEATLHDQPEPVTLQKISSKEPHSEQKQPSMQSQPSRQSRQDQPISQPTGLETLQTPLDQSNPSSRHDDLSLDSEKTIESCNKKEAIKCEECGELFTEMNLYYQHINTVGGKCFTSNVNTQRHSDNSQEKKHKCAQCGKLFLWEASMKAHHRAVHLSPKKTMKKLYEDCEKNFERIDQSEIKIHVKMLLKCSNCGLKFSSEQDLHLHYLLVHHATKKLQCKSCDRSFSYKQSLQRHVRSVHTPKRNFKCKDCGVSFLRQYDLNVHFNTESHKKSWNKKLTCEICKKSFETGAELKMHKKTDSDHIQRAKREAEEIVKKFNLSRR